MHAKRLQSSMIDRIVFDEDAATLAVSFRNSRRYLYHDVPRAIYEGLAKAQSAGGYFNERVRGRFRCEPIGRRHRPA
jgi:hypothetical protein